MIAVGQEFTTKVALLQEQRMISLVNKGLHTFPPLNPRFAGTHAFRPSSAKRFGWS